VVNHTSGAKVATLHILQQKIHGFTIALFLIFINIPISAILPETKPVNAPYIR
jgi:hypothetical protein